MGRRVYAGVLHAVREVAKPQAHLADLSQRHYGQKDGDAYGLNSTGDPCVDIIGWGFMPTRAEFAWGL